MNIESVSNPAWTDAEHTVINCIVKFAEMPVAVPFTASPNDSEQHGVDIYTACINDDYGEIAEYTAPVVTPEQRLQANAAEYERRLRLCAYAAFPLQSAVALGVATPAQQSALTAMQQYSVDLINLDLSELLPVWPVAPSPLF